MGNRNRNKLFYEVCAIQAKFRVKNYGAYLIIILLIQTMTTNLISGIFRGFRFRGGILANVSTVSWRRAQRRRCAGWGRHR